MQYKKGDWVRNTPCKWGGRGTILACNSVIPDYQYDGVKLKNCCSVLHGSYWVIAYTHKEIEQIIRFKSGDSLYTFPLDFNQFVICILEGENGLSVEQIANKLGGPKYKPLVAAVFRHPVTQARHPQAYKNKYFLKDLLSNMSEEDLKMIKYTHEDRKAKPIYMERAWGASHREANKVFNNKYKPVANKDDFRIGVSSDGRRFEYKFLD